MKRFFLVLLVLAASILAVTAGGTRRQIPDRALVPPTPDQIAQWKDQQQLPLGTLSSQPLCPGVTEKGIPGYDYAGFARYTTLPVGSYMQANIGDFGSGWGGPGEGGHIATWIGPNNSGEWIQTGLAYEDWAVNGGWMNPPQTPLAQAPFADGLYAYIEAQWNSGNSYQFGAWPVSELTYYTARVTRNSTYTYTATIAGHSLTETFNNVLTWEQAEGENLQSPANTLCNIANAGETNITPAALISTGNKITTHIADFDAYFTTNGPFTWYSPWNQGGCNPPGPCLPTR